MPNRDRSAEESSDVALVMLSNFGLADGGRETWAYNFIPRLIARHPRLRLSIFGLRVDGKPDNSVRLEELAARNASLELDFTPAPANRVPNAFYFWKGLRKVGGRFRFVLAVGSFIELVGVLLSPGLRKARKIAWLRTIFVEEKAQRLPRPLRPMFLAIERFVLGKADLIIANGDDTANFYRRLGLQVAVNRNAIDFERWRADPVRIDAGPLNVAFIGRLAPVKGIREFVALARGWDRPRAVQFHVIGSGPEEPSVREAEQAGKLVFHGALPNKELPAVLKAMDACVALTFKSASGGTAGVSNALLEQMASGRAIIAWRNEIFEQILDDSSATLVEQGSVAGLAKAVSYLLQEPDHARSMAGRAQAIAQEHSFDAHMERFDKALGELGLL